MSLFNNLRAVTSFHLGLLMLRLWLGAILIKHSSTYLFGGKMQEFAGYLTSLNFPFPELMAYVSQTTELIAAIVIILGLRLGAVLLAINMGIAVIVAHKMLIFTEGELAFNYFLLALVIAMCGTGKYGLDYVLFKKK